MCDDLWLRWDLVSIENIDFEVPLVLILLVKEGEKVKNSLFWLTKWPDSKLNRYCNHGEV